MSMELVDQSESSVSEETLPYSRTAFGTAESVGCSRAKADREIAVQQNGQQVKNSVKQGRRERHAGTGKTG